MRLAWLPVAAATLLQSHARQLIAVSRVAPSLAAEAAAVEARRTAAAVILQKYTRQVLSSKQVSALYASLAESEAHVAKLVMEDAAKGEAHRAQGSGAQGPI